MVIRSRLTRGHMGSNQTTVDKMKSIPWLGQTLASLCWIVSVFVYGYADGNGLQMSNGDWLQLAAASCWMVSNIASILPNGKS